MATNEIDDHLTEEDARPTPIPSTPTPSTPTPTQTHTLYIALPVTKKFRCPICVRLGISTVRKREGLKRHLNQDHGAGWELSYVCCNVVYSCRQHRYAFKKAKAHYEENHRLTPFETEDEDELGLTSITLHGLQERLTAATPAAAQPPLDSPILMRARSLAARARNAHRRERDLSPPRTPLRLALANPSGPKTPTPTLTPTPTPPRQRPPLESTPLSPGRPLPTSPPLPAPPAPPTPVDLPAASPPPAPPRLPPLPGSPPPPDPPASPGSPPPPGPPAAQQTEDPEQPGNLSAWQRQWLHRFPPDIPWEAFTATLSELVESLAQPAPHNVPHRPPQRPRPANQPPQRPRRPDHDTREAARIQRLYRTAPSKAMREVLQAASPFCTIPENTIKQHFEKCYATRVGCSGAPPPNCVIPPAPTPPPLLDPVTPEDVARQLKRTSNTAPGPDGIRYSVWRRRDPSGHVLAAAFNICIAARRFPQAWKESSTVLIHKKGSVAEIDNWRPIALSSTAGKLLCSLLADRISRWTSAHSIISGAQKGFTPAEGCLEHNFVLQELLDDARRRGSELSIAWLDLANAFGSVPHAALLTALRAAGLSEDQTAFIEDLYQGSSTTIRHDKGSTPPIDFGAGVRQGCPLSPVLFNLVMEYLIRPLIALETTHGASLHGTNVSVLAYADDLALVARSEAALQALLDVVTPAATWVGLRFKPAKCATLHVKKRKTIPTIFQIYGAPMKVLGEGEPYQHLGVPTGMKVDQTPVATIARLEEEVARIFESGLAPWQKLHAVRTFTIPQLEFNLKTARLKKTALKSLDASIKKHVKATMNLPTRASAELVYLPPSRGGAGLVPLADLSDLAAVIHAFRLLTSPDAKVARLALDGLAVSAGQRTADQHDLEFLLTYLNGEIPGNSNVTTTFSHARAAINRIKKQIPDIRWGYCAGRATFQLTVPEERQSKIIDRGSRNALQASLRASLQHHYRATLTAKPDQGRVARVTTTCPTSNHMLHEGRYTRFADWRFIHRARLNVLPLNGCRRWGENDRRCRRCGQQDETTAHVLCHCTAHLATGITKRHNAVQDLLVAAVQPAEGKEVRVNQRVPLSTLLPGQDVPEEVARCRPDVVVVDATKKNITIVDVAIPYEDGWQAIAAARERKLQAYAPLAQILTNGGYQTTINAFIVGSLGAWDNSNWATLRRLGVGHRHGTTLSRRCTSEAIRWSRDIYVTHVTGSQQWDG